MFYQQRGPKKKSGTLGQDRSDHQEKSYQPLRSRKTRNQGHSVKKNRAKQWRARKKMDKTTRGARRTLQHDQEEDRKVKAFSENREYFFSRLDGDFFSMPFTGTFCYYAL